MRRGVSADDTVDALFSVGVARGSAVGADEAFLCELLRARKVHSVSDLIYLQPWELRDWLLTPEEEASDVIGFAHAACAAKTVSAFELLGAATPPRPTLPL